ncbi:HNH endonuclease signature motif containing protein [Nocardioides sp. 503]|uniref:HNH endonuclease signature motif containing protein n=1 Tax=Nocardioides sp. 503 TaxID=2508326 RepID=UPI00106F996A|nr:HNH endonuclease signature motif containing protein [Nocardioides sp. 503]
MAISALPLPTPEDQVADAAAQLHLLTRHDWSQVPDLELVSAVEALQGLRAVAHAAEAVLLAEIEARGVVKEKLGWGSTADWFGHLAGVRHGQAKQTVEHATELVANRPVTWSALASGDISPEQADIVLNTLDRLPGDERLRESAETQMLDEASRVTATELARHGRGVIETLDPAHTARTTEAQLAREDRVAHQRRFLSITDDGAGGVVVKGRGSVEDGATLRAAMLPLTAPVPEIDPDTCQELPDRRDYGVRMWDALLQLAQHALDTDLPPESHGARPRVAVTVGLEALRGTLVERGRTDDGLDVSPDVARRLACDADIIPMVLGTDGEVLDVGRTRRLVTAPLWRALVVRDRHCAFPGCTRPPVMCHAHHLVPWADGGTTSLSNLVLLCGHHHRTVHQTPWEVRIGSDGRPEFRPPPRLGVVRDWMRARPRRE